MVTKCNLDKLYYNKKLQKCNLFLKKSKNFLFTIYATCPKKSVLQRFLEGFFKKEKFVLNF